MFGVKNKTKKRRERQTSRLMKRQASKDGGQQPCLVVVVVVVSVGDEGTKAKTVCVEPTFCLRHDHPERGSVGQSVTRGAKTRVHRMPEHTKR